MKVGVSRLFLRKATEYTLRFGAPFRLCRSSVQVSCESSHGQHVKVWAKQKFVYENRSWPDLAHGAVVCPRLVYRLIKTGTQIVTSALILLPSSILQKDNENTFPFFPSASFPSSLLSFLFSLFYFSSFFFPAFVLFFLFMSLFSLFYFIFLTSSLSSFLPLFLPPHH